MTAAAAEQAVAPRIEWVQTGGQASSGLSFPSSLSLSLSLSLFLLHFVYLRTTGFLLLQAMLARVGRELERRTDLRVHVLGQQMSLLEHQERVEQLRRELKLAFENRSLLFASPAVWQDHELALCLQVGLNHKKKK